MPRHPLQQRVRAVAALARRWQVVYAVGVIAATLVGAVLLWGLLDAWLRVAEVGVRLIATAAILLMTALAAWRFAWPAWRAKLTEMQVAQRIERHFPELGDRLSSSLAFLSQDEGDKLAGSAALRRALVAETMGLSDGLDFRQAVNAAGALKIATLALGIVLVAGALALAQPQAALLVLERTFFPWTSASWPRRHQLEFASAPDRLATGGDFEAVVVDAGGDLPESVTIIYQFDDDDQEQRREMKLLDGKMVHRLEGVTRSFKYKAIGGDDTAMAWRELKVIEPPQVASLDVKITPPAYTGWPSEAASPDFRALEGSAIELSGEVDKPIASAKLKLEGASDAATEAGIAVADSGLSFKLPRTKDKPWLLAQASAYAIELTSAEGFASTGARYELRMVPDRPPVIVVEQPADNASVTLTAVLPLRVLVKDDLAIARVELKYLRSDQSEAGEQSIELFAGPASVAKVATSPLREGALPGESQLVEFTWNLAELKDLAPGVTLTWHVAASDYKPQVGVSPAQRLAIISQEELEDRIAQRQNAILLALQESLRKQQQARSGVAALATQLEAVGKLNKGDHDQLQSVELEQRQVQRGLTSQADGVLGQVALLLGELESNRVDSPEVARRMTQIAAEIKRLAHDPLPASERELNTALKITRDEIDKNEPKSAAQAPTAAALAAAGTAQDETIASLEKILGDLSEFDNYRRFARDVSRLRADQEALRKETSELQPKTIGRTVRELDGQELASIRRAAQRQTELARELDKLIGRMADARTKLAESQPLAASTLADALDAARGSGISSQMLDTSRSVEQNQLGAAATEQQNIVEQLSELQDILSGRKEHELGRRIQQLRASAADLQNMRTQLKGNQTRTAAAAKLANEAERKRQLERLSKEQQRIAEQAERLARRLERLQSEQASAKVGAASGKSGEASQSSQQGDGQKALEDLASAEKSLEEAQQQLEQDLAQAEQDLFFEQVAKLEQAIQGLVGRQKSVVDETARLENLKRNQDGEWTPSQRTSVRSVTEQERDLVAETTAFAQKLKEAAAFGLALEGAVREMTRATARLDRFLTDADTQAAEQIALARLEQLLEALKPEEPMEGDPPPEPMGNDGGGNQGQQMPPGDALHLLAELKLLKLMQQEINRRTTELEKLRQTGKLGADQQNELADLAVEQGKLAELVLNLGEKAAKQAAQAGETNNLQLEGDKPPPTGNNPLDEELNKSLDNELLPK